MSPGVMNSRRLSVVQLLPALNVGGVERGTLEVAKELVKRGHRSIVISAGGRLVDDLVNTGSEHIQLDVGRKSPLTSDIFLFFVDILRKKTLMLSMRDPVYLHGWLILPGKRWTRPAGQDL